jgi:two-component system, NtrC family, nitrogen regulation sensor histidine kinase NtrY
MNPFRWQSLLRIALLTATLFLCVYFYSAGQYAVAGCIVCAAGVQVYLLFRFVDSANAELIRFLQGINYSDFSQHARIGSLGASFKELSEELERIITNFRQARIEKEESLQYLQTVVEHVEIGLICFNARGDVTLYNKTAGRILSTPYLKNVSALNKKHDRLGELLVQMTPNTKRTYRLGANGAAQQLLISAAEFRMKDQPMKLISLHNIQAELEANEIEAWQKLIKVLTHEIMNSITPISSLASTVDAMLKHASAHGDLGTEAIEDICAAVSTIHKRSEGLIHFVNKYRDISKAPQPNFQPVKVAELLYRVRLLMERAFTANNIRFVVSVTPETLEIIADPELMEQVLLNLVHNSIHALEQMEDKHITISAGVDERGKTVIRVADNGKGIPDAIIEKIFIPFFSTKQEGSGIGLSISQRIVRAHGGSLWASSHHNGETIFTIAFQAT